MLTVDEIRRRIIPLCRIYGAESVYLFGSYARGEASESSDVDLRIDLGDMSALNFCSFYVDVEEALSCAVDILTTRQMPKEFLKHVQQEEVLIYVREKHTAA